MLLPVFLRLWGPYPPPHSALLGIHAPHNGHAEFRKKKNIEEIQAKQRTRLT